MKLLVHWSVDGGLVVDPPEEVEITVVDEAGHLAEDAKDFALEVANPLRDGAQVTATWAPGRFAACKQRLAKPGLVPFRVRFVLRQDGALLDRASALLASSASVRLRAVAGLMFFAMVVAWLLLSTALQDTWALLTGSIPLFLGALAFIKEVREAVWRWLLDGRWALACSLATLLVLGITAANVVKVENQTPEDRTLGTRVLKSGEAVFILGNDLVVGQCAADDTTDHGEFSTRKVTLGTTWLPWFFRCELRCGSSVPPPLLEDWWRSGQCAPKAINVELSTCTPSGHAHWSFSSAEPAKYTAVMRSNECWAGSEENASIKVTDALGLKLVSHGADSNNAVDYDPTTVGLLRLASKVGEFEFHGLEGKRGITRFAPTKNTVECVTFTNGAGVASLTFGAKHDAEHSTTLIDQPFRPEAVPVCAHRSRPERGQIVFGEGWVPQASGALTLPGNFVPKLLTLRTARGEWLGSLQTEQWGSTEVAVLEVVPADWKKVQDLVEVGWEAPGKAKVAVPTRTSVGGLYWRLREPSNTRATGESHPLVDARMGSIPYQVTFDEKANYALAEQKPAGPCYFDKKTNKPLARACGKPLEGKVPESVVLNAGMRCSLARYCSSLGEGGGAQ